MIQLNLDLAYLAKHFEIGTERLNQYAGKTIEEVMSAEAQAGNTKALYYDSNVLNNPSAIVQLFQLMDPQNRFMIIRNLSEKDLQYILPFLSKQDLMWGLRFFTQDKLMQMINQLPKDEVVRFTFLYFDMEQILELMPDKEMNKFLKNEKIEKNSVLKYFKALDKEELDRIMENYLGIPMEDSSREDSLKMLQELPDKEFQDFILGMDRKDKGGLISFLVQDDPKLLMEFDNETLTRPFQMMQKDDLLKCMTDIKDEFILKMVEQLPQDLLQIVATQIDPAKFADILIEKFPDVLAQMAI